MSAITDTLTSIATTIEESGCLNDSAACWTGRTATRHVFFDDEAALDPDYEGHEFLYFEFADKLDDGSLDVVWIPEDALAKAPMMTPGDMEDYFSY